MTEARWQIMDDENQIAWIVRSRSSFDPLAPSIE